MAYCNWIIAHTEDSSTLSRPIRQKCNVTAGNLPQTASITSGASLDDVFMTSREVRCLGLSLSLLNERVPERLADFYGASSDAGGHSASLITVVLATTRRHGRLSDDSDISPRA